MASVDCSPRTTAIESVNVCHLCHFRSEFGLRRVLGKRAPRPLLFIVACAAATRRLPSPPPRLPQTEPKLPPPPLRPSVRLQDCTIQQLVIPWVSLCGHHVGLLAAAAAAAAVRASNRIHNPSERSKPHHSPRQTTRRPPILRKLVQQTSRRPKKRTDKPFLGRNRSSYGPSR
jgi:hypothetical protein